MIDRNTIITKISDIKRRLDYTTNLLVSDEYEKAGVQMVSGYIDYHNLLKNYKILKDLKYKNKEEKQCH